MRETKVEKHLIKQIKAFSGECFKWTSPGRIGVPDRIVLVPHERIVFVETKAPKGKAKAWQKRNHAVLRALSFRVEVLHTIEQIDDFLLTL